MKKPIVLGNVNEGYDQIDHVKKIEPEATSTNTPAIVYQYYTEAEVAGMMGEGDVLRLNPNVKIVSQLWTDADGNRYPRAELSVDQQVIADKHNIVLPQSLATYLVHGKISKNKRKVKSAIHRWKKLTPQKREELKYYKY